MSKKAKRTTGAERLRASPNFALMFDFGGRAYVAKDSEPYVQYWLDERYRVLLSLFSSRRGASRDEAVTNYLRLTGKAGVTERKRLARAIDDMRAAGVLVGARDDASRYDKSIVEAYVTHRPFPREISDAIIRDAKIGENSDVLDLAGGPGDLALALARASRRVTMMDLSRGFVNAAAARAKKLGLTLSAVQDSCNRLVYRDDQYDVITISQALHWLDDLMVCKGVTRLLRDGGSFVVVHVAFDVADDHPIAHLLGHKSILGEKARRPFVDEVGALQRRLSLLFEALDAPDVDRVDLAGARSAAGVERIRPDGVGFYRQRRPMGAGFARGFLTDRHIEATGLAPAAFWKDVDARCASTASEKIAGDFDWAVLRFRRGAGRSAQADVAITPVEIGYSGPPDG